MNMALFLFLVLFAFPSAAEDPETWLVATSSGTVLLLADDGSSRALAAGDRLEAGARIRTMSGGRAVLARGEDVITMSPGTDLVIPAPQPGFGTRVIQAVGRAFYEITKGAAPHFEVDSPYLAAVVKGTKFEVSADAAAGDAVRVLDGRVEVRNLRDGRAAPVNAGQVGRVRSAGSTGVEVEEQTTDSGGNGNAHGGGAGPRGNGSGGGEP